MKNPKLNLVDIISLIYITWVLAICITFFNKINNASNLIITFSVYFIYIFIIHYLYKQHPKNIIILILKFAYPVLTFAFLYKSIESYVTVFYDRFLDDLVINIQAKLFLQQPVLFLEQFVNPVLNEVMKFSYFSYYFYVPVSVILLIIQKRFQDLHYFVFIITFTFYVCYIGFVLWPVQGPRFGLKSYFGIPYLKGYIITTIQNFLMQKGQTIGAAMPSSHLAVAWNTLFLIKKFFGKRPFYIILPIIMTMSIAIVYNRYHYFLDGVLGIATGFLCYQIGKRIFKKYQLAIFNK